LNTLKGFQKKYLRGLAHNMKPVVLIGQKGSSGTVINAIISALTKHELIKVKFVDFKDKDQKTEILDAIIRESGSENVGMVGHTVILYREHDDPEKRRIIVPQRNISG